MTTIQGVTNLNRYAVAVRDIDLFPIGATKIINKDQFYSLGIDEQKGTSRTFGEAIFSWKMTDERNCLFSVTRMTNPKEFRP